MEANNNKDIFCRGRTCPNPKPRSDTQDGLGKQPWGRLWGWPQAGAVPGRAHLPAWSGAERGALRKGRRERAVRHGAAPLSVRFEEEMR